MKHVSHSFFLLAVLAAPLLPGCVPARKYDSLQSSYRSAQQAREDAERQQRQQAAELKQANAELAELTLDKKRLVNDSTQTGNILRKTQSLYTELNNTYDKLLKNNDRAMADKSAQYNQVAKDLARREAELGELDTNLQKSRGQIDQLNTDLKTREAKLAELQKALDAKDKAVGDLRKRVSDALLGFKSNDLNVELRNGKVYVSLSEQLLFKSGSTKVDPKGQDALKKLAQVLREQPDVNVVVEGHTDNVPISRGTAGMQDNWDLSVLRATEIARLLTSSGVAPQRVTASGRSQYLPVAPNDNAADKARNRRTEIILTPKLNELFQILDSNSAAATAPGK